MRTTAHSAIDDWQHGEVLIVGTLRLLLLLVILRCVLRARGIAAPRPRGVVHEDCADLSPRGSDRHTHTDTHDVCGWPRRALDARAPRHPRKFLSVLRLRYFSDGLGAPAPPGGRRRDVRPAHRARTVTNCRPQGRWARGVAAQQRWGGVQRVNVRRAAHRRRGTKVTIRRCALRGWELASAGCTAPIPVDIDDCLMLDQILRFLETQVARSEDTTHLELDLLHLKKYQEAAARLKVRIVFT